ncbi:MAG TPA: DUF4349 domain-containing protein [Rhizomicrobium sp.]|nr:DUF4349 domain-containing protein [Rhizomicrobium sp.]
MRKSILLLALPLFLAGCDRRPEGVPLNLPYAAPQLMKPPAFVPPADIAMAGNSNGNGAFSYMHALALIMPHASLEPRYERARDRCLHDIALNCKLISSSINKSADDGTGYSAQLVVALPHDKIAAYEKGLTAPVAGEAKGDAQVTSSSTSAENVTQGAATASRKVAQLSDYRDRLLALLKRPNLSVDDLIKVEDELAKTQSDLDEALTQKTDIDDRVAREQMSISLDERSVAAGPFQPIADVWRQSVGILAESTASMLRFVVAYIPWLPLIVGALLLLRWFWRIARRRPSDARSGPG